MLRQSLLRSGAAYTIGELQNLPVLQLAPLAKTASQGPPHGSCRISV